jgi:hypothetical protein
MASVFCGVQQPDFVQLDCGTELGGIVAIALINADETPTLANLREASFWTSKLAASPQKYFVISDTRGSYPGGTPVEEEGYGRTVTLRTGADHEATVEVRGVLANRGFMASVNQTATWNVVAVTNDGIGHYIEDASVYAKMVIDQSIKSSERWSLSIKWSDDLSNPEVFVAPTAIFG